MNHDNSNERTRSIDTWGELLSAHQDGETTAAEAATVEQRLATDPAVQRLADELSEVSRRVKQAPAAKVASRDLKAAVLAEALSRQAAGEGAGVEPARNLEPEGALGLPFGSASRGWAWAGVAVAATVLISFFGKPGHGPPARDPVIAMSREHDTSREVEQALQAMRKSTPGLQVVNYQATPQVWKVLQRRLALQRASLPGVLGSAQPQGVIVEPVDGDQPLLEDGEEQLIYVDADPGELDRLLKEVEAEQGGVYRVGGEAPPGERVEQAKGGAARVSLPATPLRLKLGGRSGPVVSDNAPPKNGRRVLILRIRLSPSVAK